MPELVQHAEGVYLGLRETDYHSDWALGSTAMKDLHASPPEWWWTSPFNPLRPPQKPKDAFALGSAAHVLFLEGMDVYEAVYGIAPQPADYPDHLNTLDQLKDACRARSIPVTGTKPDLTTRLKLAVPNIQIFDDVVKAWLDQGLRPVTQAQDATIRLMHRMAMRSAAELRLAEDEGVTLREAFTGGLSEVSVFWTEHDVIRQRARFDKLKPNITLDLKTFTEWKRKNFKKALLEEITYRGYILQAVHYEEARNQLRRLVAEGKVYGGTPEQRKLLEEIAEAESWAWGWVFGKASGAPQVKGIIPDKLGGQFAEARQIREAAMAGFLQYYEYWDGLETMWVDPEVIYVPEHNDWPTFSTFSDE